MPTWSRRRTRSLARDVSRLIEGLDARPELRKRLRRHGYDEQAHREMAACLARLGGLDAGHERGPKTSLLGSARAVSGWLLEQVAVASRFATKLPGVASEAADTLRGRTEPLKMLGRGRRLLGRVRSDEHLSHFLTLEGLRDAGAELTQRIHDGGRRGPRSQREQVRAELAFLYARWRQACIQELGDEPELLRALGLEPDGR